MSRPFALNVAIKIRGISLGILDKFIIFALSNCAILKFMKFISYESVV